MDAPLRVAEKMLGSYGLSFDQARTDPAHHSPMKLYCAISARAMVSATPLPHLNLL